MVGLVAGIGLAFSALVGFVVNLCRRNRGLRADNKRQKKALVSAVKKQDEITNLHNEQQRVQEEANEQREELQETDDSDLIDSANNLFP